MRNHIYKWSTICCVLVCLLISPREGTMFICLQLVVSFFQATTIPPAVLSDWLKIQPLFRYPQKEQRHFQGRPFCFLDHHNIMINFSKDIFNGGVLLLATQTFDIPWNDLHLEGLKWNLIAISKYQNILFETGNPLWVAFSYFGQNFPILNNLWGITFFDSPFVYISICDYKYNKLKKSRPL